MGQAQRRSIASHMPPKPCCFSIPSSPPRPTSVRPFKPSHPSWRFICDGKSCGVLLRAVVHLLHSGVAQESIHLLLDVEGPAAAAAAAAAAVAALLHVSHM
jgi:hypothetical protein